MKLDFLSGVVEKITMNTVNKTTHELIIHFYFKCVKDRLKWKDITNKSLGYHLIKGSKDMSVQLVSLKK